MTYDDIANSHNLQGNTRQRYLLYMNMRWSDEMDVQCKTGYAREWAERFLAGIEYMMSDGEGQKALREIDGIKEVEK